MNEEITFSEEHSEGMPEKGKIVHEKGLGYTLTVDREDLLKAALGLKEAGFDLFMFATGIDYPDSIKLVYRIYSTKRKNRVSIFIKTEVPKNNPVIDSLVSLWPAANWHERETYDLFGVEFIGHPDMRRILMPEDWVGHPLRKDYSDGHMLVMDDGSKKEKPATDSKAQSEVPKKEKPAATQKAEESGDKETETSAPEGTNVAESKAVDVSQGGEANSLEQENQTSTDGYDNNE